MPRFVCTNMVGKIFFLDKIKRLEIWWPLVLAYSYEFTMAENAAKKKWL